MASLVIRENIVNAIAHRCAVSNETAVNCVGVVFVKRDKLEKYSGTGNTCMQNNSAMNENIMITRVEWLATLSAAIVSDTEAMLWTR